MAPGEHARELFRRLLNRTGRAEQQAGMAAACVVGALLSRKAPAIASAGRALWLGRQAAAAQAAPCPFSRRRLPRSTPCSIPSSPPHPHLQPRLPRAPPPTFAASPPLCPSSSSSRRASHTLASVARVVGGPWASASSGLRPDQLRALRWYSPREYLRYVNRLLSDAVAPYWSGASWGSFAALSQQTSTWLPSLPAARAHAYMFTLNAVNLAGSNLPRLLVFTVAELARNNSQAQAFEYFVDVPPSTPVSPHGWYATAALDLFRTAVHCFKVLWLLMLFTPVLLLAPLALYCDVGRHDWFVLLRQTLEASGPAFIKWGQWAATRQDMFPPDMCKQLGQLQTQAPEHNYKFTKRSIEEAFGISIAELFDKFEPAPMASGSIGQIHRGLLSEKGSLITGFPAGTAVAVKVRHPGVGDAILRDFKTMMWLATLVNNLPALRHLQLEETLKQFAAPLQEQVDLSREASNLRRFNHNFRSARDVLFPVPLYPLVTCDVLVETFQEGDHITDYIAADQNPYNTRLSELGSGLMLQMMLIDNLIHSDLHPGNILVRLEPPSGLLLGPAYRLLDAIRRSDQVDSTTRARITKVQSGWLQPKMVLLDVGMATELSAQDQVNMVGLFRAFAALDGEAVADWTMAFSGELQTCPSPEAFRLGMVHVFDSLQQPAAYASQVPCALKDEASEFNSSAAALSSVLEMVRQHKVCLPGHICAVLVTTLVLEGWSSQLDDSHSVLSMVHRMFQDHVPWGERVAGVVDACMGDQDSNLVGGSM